MSKYVLQFFTVVKKRSDLFFISLCVLIGGIFRLTFALTQLGWWNDPSRDFLAGYHIVHFHEYPFLGPACSGFQVGLYYPVYYYYFIALLIRIYDSPFFVTSVFSLLQTVGIIFFFYLAKNLLNRSSAYIATTFFTFSTLGIMMGGATVSAYSSMPFLFIGSYFMIKAIKKRHVSHAFFGIFFLTISNAINYNSLLVTLLFLLWSLITFRKRKMVALSICVYAAFLFLAINFNNILFYGLPTFLLFFLSTQNLSSHPDVISNLTQIFKMSLHWIFPELFIGCFLTASLITVLIFKLKASFRPLIPLLITIFIHLFFLAIKGSTFYEHQTFIFLPFYILTVSYLLSEAWRRSKKNREVKALVLFVGATLFFYSSKSPLGGPRNPIYNEYESLSEVLIPKIENKNSFDLIVNIGDDHWSESTNLWYFLEKKLGQKLRLINDYDSFDNLNSFPHEYIIVCSDYSHAEDRKSCEEVRQIFETTYKDFKPRDDFILKGKYRVYMYKNDNAKVSDSITSFRFNVSAALKKKN